VQNEANVLQQLEWCLKEIISWMTNYKLKMNQSKTEVIFYGTRQQLAKLKTQIVNVGDCSIKCVDHVRDIGVTMTKTLNFDQHI
jgi:hypothetical protein